MLFSLKKIKKFVSFYKPYKLLLAANIFCASITTLSGLALPLFIRYITGEVLVLGSGDAAPLIYRTAGIMLALIIIQTISGIFVDYKGHYMGAMIERDMREELFRHCQRLPIRFFDREKTGVLMSRITNDLLDLSEVLHHGPEILFIYLISYIGGFVILFRIDIKLTLVVFAFLPLLVIYTAFFQKKLMQVYRESREKIAGLNAGLEDTLAGVRVVKSFTNEQLEDRKFSLANETFSRGRVNIYRNEAFYYSMMEYFFTPLIVAGVVIAGGVFISHSVLSVPDLIVFLLYISYITGPIIRFAQTFGMYQNAFAGFNRFMEILEMESEKIAQVDSRQGVNTLQGGLDDSRAPRFLGRLEFINASFRYGEELENVIENISMVIEPGESAALVGSSGAGKTTLCSLIPRFYELSAGKITIDGMDISGMDLGVLRQNIGVVAQDVYLFSGTVTENIRYGKPGASEDEIINAAKLAKAHDFIMELPKGYETEIGQRGILLSGGQRQRLSIARVFLKDPPILILDEATSALDYENEKAIHESLDGFLKNRTVLIIAHRLSTIKKAGKIFSLEGRSIIETEIPFEGGQGNGYL